MHDLSAAKVADPSQLESRLVVSCRVTQGSTVGRYSDMPDFGRTAFMIVQLSTDLHSRTDLEALHLSPGCQKQVFQLCVTLPAVLGTKFFCQAFAARASTDYWNGTLVLQAIACELYLIAMACVTRLGKAALICEVQLTQLQREMHTCDHQI